MTSLVLHICEGDHDEDCEQEPAGVGVVIDALAQPFNAGSGQRGCRRDKWRLHYDKIKLWAAPRVSRWW